MTVGTKFYSVIPGTGDERIIYIYMRRICIRSFYFTVNKKKDGFEN